ncbi:MAG: TonB-dependent receptor [Myxococcales bacterium]|nr:TonB-dependent receptor [Myxococcales bacterium]
MTCRPSLIPVVALVLLCATPAVAEVEDLDHVSPHSRDLPFDRDTQYRLSGGELAWRGAVDLGSALAMIPEVIVRSDGRGGRRIELRDARDASVSVMLDGVLVADPYGGTVDISTIPITDIARIQISTRPQSPIDGLGGAGGMIEIHTRRASAAQLVVARLFAASSPGVALRGMARVTLARRLSLRLSGSGEAGARDLEPVPGAALDEQRRAATAGARLEYRAGDLRISLDGLFDRRRHVAPSNTELPSTFLLIDRKTTARFAATVDDTIGKLQLRGQVWSQYVSELARYFADAALTSQTRIETLKALRSGLLALAGRPFLRDFRWTGSVMLDFQKAVAATQLEPTATPTRSHTTLLEIGGALSYGYVRGPSPVRAELALGLAIPFLVHANPWPELKAVTEYRPREKLLLTATLAYKGRAPTLRELFDQAIGNPNLRATHIAHAELRADVWPTDGVWLGIAPYYRHVTDTIRGSTEPRFFGQLINQGTASYAGVDAHAGIALGGGFLLGGSYGFVESSSDQPDDVMRDLLPRHRWDAWIRSVSNRRVDGMVRATYAARVTDGSARLGSYVTVEASLTARLAAGYSAVLRVDDLLDARPEMRAGEPGVGRVVSLMVQGMWW